MVADFLIIANVDRLESHIWEQSILFRIVSIATEWSFSSPGPLTVRIAVGGFMLFSNPCSIILFFIVTIGRILAIIHIEIRIDHTKLLLLRLHFSPHHVTLVDLVYPTHYLPEHFGHRILAQFNIVLDLVNIFTIFID